MTETLLFLHVHEQFQEQKLSSSISLINSYQNSNSIISGFSDSPQEQSFHDITTGTVFSMTSPQEQSFHDITTGTVFSMTSPQENPLWAHATNDHITMELVTGTRHWNSALEQRTRHWNTPDHITGTPLTWPFTTFCVHHRWLQPNIPLHCYSGPVDFSTSPRFSEYYFQCSFIQIYIIHYVVCACHALKSLNFNWQNTGWLHCTFRKIIIRFTLLQYRSVFLHWSVEKHRG